MSEIEYAQIFQNWIDNANTSFSLFITILFAYLLAGHFVAKQLPRVAAFGMTLLEAQYQGVAILSGDEGGVSHVMANGITGELVPARDAQALGLAIQRLLTDTGQLQHYRQQTRSYVETNHSLAQAAEVLKNEISACLQEFKGA